MPLVSLHSQLVEAARDAGAYEACVIPVSDIVLSEAFRDICESNQCGKFNACWMCPPNVASPAEAIGEVRSYSHALWYQSVSSLEDEFDIEGMLEAGCNHAHLSQRLEGRLSSLLNGAHLHLSSGGCRLCERCTKPDDLPCRHPEAALSSLEAYCVDVYQTTKSTDMPYALKGNAVVFFGAVLF